MLADAKRQELTDLVTLLCDGALDQPDLDKLERLLLDDPEAQAYYQRFVALDVELAWSIAGHPAPLSLSFNGEPAGSATTGGLSQFSSDENGTVPLLPPIVTDGQSGDWRSDDSFNRDPQGSVPGTENISQVPNPTPYLGFLGSAYNGVTGYIGDHDSGAGRPRRHGVPRPAVRGLGERRNILAVAAGQPPAAARQSDRESPGGACRPVDRRVRLPLVRQLPPAAP